MRVRLIDLCRGGHLMTWYRIMGNDLKWKEQIYDLPSNVLSFRLNGISMTLPSISNLRRWGIRKWGTCYLCNVPNTTSAHVLSHCSFALFQGRYTWRHDNVLATWATHCYGIANRAIRINSKQQRTRVGSFVKAGCKQTTTRTPIFSLLHKYNATDWKVNIDFNHTPTIPVRTNVDTLLRPYVVFYTSHKTVIIWDELTVALERNILDAQLRKR